MKGNFKIILKNWSQDTRVNQQKIGLSPVNIKTWDSIDGIATGYGLDDQGVEVQVPVGSRIFSTSSRLTLGSTKLPIQWVTGTLSSGVKRPGHEADHWPPASTGAKKMRIYTSTSPHTFMA
jgi:hypothetical protein